MVVVVAVEVEVGVGVAVEVEVAMHTEGAPISTEGGLIRHGELAANVAVFLWQ